MNASSRLPRVVYVLAACTFMLGTTEFMVAGQLPEISRALHVSVARSGLLISAFAIGMIFGAPLMALATMRLPRRATLMVALGLFAAGHVMAAVSDSFVLVAVSRVIASVATGAFWATAAVVVSTAAGPRAGGRSLGVLVTGLTAANVIGVPLGTWVAHSLSWRIPFWALAVAAVAFIPVVASQVPHDERHEPKGLGSELRSMRSGRLWLVYAGTALYSGGVMAGYAYVSPLLTRRAGIAEGAVALVLVAFGLGALAGSTAGGRLADRGPLQRAIAAIFLTAATLLLLGLLSTSAVLAVVFLILLGFTGFTANPMMSSLAIRLVRSPTLPMSFLVAAFNVGNALGPWLGSLVLDGSLGAKGPSLVGCGLGALALAPLLVLLAGRGSNVLTGVHQEPADGADSDGCACDSAVAV